MMILLKDWRLLVESWKLLVHRIIHQHLPLLLKSLTMKVLILYGAVFTNLVYNYYHYYCILTTDIGICGNIVPHLKSYCSADALCKVSANGRKLLNCSCNVGYLGTGLICRSKYPGNLKLIEQLNITDFIRY